MAKLTPTNVGQFDHVGNTIARFQRVEDMEDGPEGVTAEGAVCHRARLFIFYTNSAK